MNYFLAIVTTLLLVIIGVAVNVSMQRRESFMNSKEKQTILITGSTRGIGLALAKRLLKANYTVYIHGQSQESVDAALSDIGDGDGSKGIAADLMTYEGCAKLIAGLKTAHIDALVHCAAPEIVHKKIADIDPKEWEKDQAVHLNAAVYLAKLAAPFLAPRGRLVLVSSGASEFEDTLGGAIPASYIIAKHGLEKLTIAIASEWNSAKGPIVTCVRVDKMVGPGLEISSEEAAARFEKILALPDTAVNGRIVSLSHISQDKSAAFISEANLSKFKMHREETDAFTEEDAAYPVIDPPRNLLEALGSYAGVPADSIAVFPGTIAAIDAIMSVTPNPDKRVLISDPEWAPLELYLKKHRIPIQKGTGTGAGTGAESGAGAGPDTRAVYITSPNYETGESIDIATLDRLVAKLPSDVPIIIDQCYIDYAKPGSVFTVDRALVLKYPRVIGIRSMSKFMELAALRIAVVIAHPDVAKALHAQTVSPFLTPSIISKVIARCQDTDWQNRKRDDLDADREVVVKKLGRMPHRAGAVPWVLADLPKGLSWDQWQRELKADGIVAEAEAEASAKNYVKIPLASPQMRPTVDILVSLGKA